jgi:GNAT superfamily N-acetyltransferase
MMKVRYAKEEDFCLIQKLDSLVIEPDFQKWVHNKQVLLIYEDEAFAGWLQYSFFLERIPFINEFYLKPEFRGTGTGTLSLLIWERQMMERMYDKFMTAICADDTALIDFFEQKGYKKIGDITIPENENRVFYFKHKPLF